MAIDEIGEGGHAGGLAAPPGGAKGRGAAGLALAALARGVVEALYPPACVACGAETEAAHALCGTCWRDAGFLAGSLPCDLCGTPLPGLDEGVAVHCDECLRVPRPWERGRAALAYRGTARALVLALKHGDRTDLARPLGQWLARAARPLLDGATDPVLVPVPLHWTRLFMRRHNQAALLAWSAGRALGVPVAPDALVRLRRTAALGLMGPDARHQALDAAIGPHPRRRGALKGRGVILVDDVMTTGATLAATAEAARAAGAASVQVLVLARAVRGGD